MSINFFFQAEDGIRDYKVTGVQTCALPISLLYACLAGAALALDLYWWHKRDRKSTRLNSSHLVISYAVFCLKKKINEKKNSAIYKTLSPRIPSGHLHGVFNRHPLAQIDIHA